MAAGFTLIEILVVMVIIGVLASLVVVNLTGRRVSDELETESDRLAQLFKLASEEAELQGQQIGWRYGKNGYEFLIANGPQWTPIQSGEFRPRTLPGPLEQRLTVEGHVVKPVALDGQNSSASSNTDSKSSSDSHSSSSSGADSGSSSSSGADKDGVSTAQIAAAASSVLSNGSSSGTGSSGSGGYGESSNSDDDSQSKIKGVEPQVLFLSSGEVTPFSLDLLAPSEPFRQRLEINLLGQIKRSRVAEKDA